MKKTFAKILTFLFLLISLLAITPQNSYAGILPGPERCTPSGGGLWGWVTDANTGIDTAIGCIPLELGFFGSAGGASSFVAFMLRWSIGLGGGIAFLLIVYAGFMITTSAGNPQRLQAGRELLTSAMAGLFMLLFSVFILRVIGIDILGLGQVGL